MFSQPQAAWSHICLITLSEISTKENDVLQHSLCLQQVELFLSADSDRRRLLEEPDYWAMSDLQDLWKGQSCPLLLWLNGAMEGASSLAMALCAW